jgi:hypothetical protein
MSLICKTNLKSIAKELNQASLKFECLCLLKTQKWCNEILFCIEDVDPFDDTCSINYSSVSLKKIKKWKKSIKLKFFL